MSDPSRLDHLHRNLKQYYCRKQCQTKNMSNEQKTKQSIHNTSRKIAKEVSSHFNMEIDMDALDIIAELSYKKIQMYGLDLDAFQKHAKRSTINADDVKLLVRRNESLKELVDSKLQTINSLKPTEAANSSKRKRK